MYIVQCKEDKHFILLDYKYVICDHNTVKLEDCVAFLYGGKTYRGVVKKIGDDPEEMYHDYKSCTEVQYTIEKEATSPKKKRKSKQNLPKIKNEKTKKSVPVKSSTEILKQQIFTRSTGTGEISFLAIRGGYPRALAHSFHRETCGRGVSKVAKHAHLKNPIRDAAPLQGRQKS
ncbi:hypothetical protein QAD02_018411 [Eretmocerus hayati]|uniref:Uncharacterized protein n=1 Tax=Eretmocerus hayati TaxID=131215 RepID=A0ACC2PH41_9HYME|nr:hypothetical protein QAD02_018411 [Eretmocerus hayati]